MTQPLSVLSETPSLKSECETVPEMARKSEPTLAKASSKTFLNLAMGAIGLQFAWAMQINLTGRVIEPLGATPIILGLIWLAGPITGILVQPIIGAYSDNIRKRRPFLLLGAILGSLALLALPYASSLLIAAAFLWMIDICVNVSQGPHRALVSDIIPEEQQALSNSFFSFAVAIGSIVAFGFPYLLEKVFHVQISIPQQFMIAALVCTVAMAWTCITTPEAKATVQPEDRSNPFETVMLFLKCGVISALVVTVLCSLGFLGTVDWNNTSFITNTLSWFILILSFPMLALALKSFYSPKIAILCAMQYFTWLGMMCLFIYFNSYVVHCLFQIPDLSTATETVKTTWRPLETEATNFAGFGFAAFNFVCLLVSIPIGLLCNKFHKGVIHACALAIMAIAFLGLGYIAKTTGMALLFVGLAGVGWASILTIPYALVMEYAPKDKVGLYLGKFNLFIAGPQILSSILVGFIINSNKLILPSGVTNHWEYAFIVAGVSVLIASVIALLLKRSPGVDSTLT